MIGAAVGKGERGHPHRVILVNNSGSIENEFTVDGPMSTFTTTELDGYYQDWKLREQDRTNGGLDMYFFREGPLYNVRSESP
jgi:hypothetical protein